jgi:hypothetical protein
MQVQDCVKIYFSYVKQTSDIVRQMGLAGIALIWASKIEGKSNFTIEPAMISAGIFLLIGLACDLLQHIAGTAIWAIFARLKEISSMTTDSPDFYVPTKINWPTILLFWLKIISVLTGYALIITYLIRRLL